MSGEPDPIPPDVKPGKWTTENLQSVIHQAMSLLVLVGAVAAGDSVGLESALSRAVAAGAALLSSAWVVTTYIRSRTSLKAGATDAEEERT